MSAGTCVGSNVIYRGAGARRLAPPLEHCHSSPLSLGQRSRNGQIDADPHASAGGFSWPLPEGLDDAALEAALFPAPPPSRVPRPEPNWEHVHRELQRHKGATLQLLWLEYRAAHANGYGYSWFCERYRAWRGRIDVVMRQVYRAGEKAFVDYAGPKFEVVDRKTGEARDVMVFVGVLGASNHTFVDVTRSRSLPDWTNVARPDVRVLERRAGTRDPGQREGRGP